jgi:ABC-type multidrug transport system, ATPase component
MLESIITINLSRYFGDVKALEDINIKVNKGEIFGLLGPNGSGKTTLIRILTTALLPTKGEAYVLGYDVKKDYLKIRKYINIVSGDEKAGYGVLTVRENLWFFSQLYGYNRSEGWRIVNELIEKFGMQEYADRKINRISHGMFQKYNFVRGLLNNPLVLFLDEPTLGLDVNISREIRNYIKEWIKEDRERTVILTTHYMVEAQELCDRIAIIYKGKIITVDTVENLLRILSKESVYEIKTNLINQVEKIKSIQGVKAIDVENDASRMISKIRVVVSEDSVISDLLSFLKNEGIKVISLSKEEVTLEDVFLYLVGRKL